MGRESDNYTAEMLVKQLGAVSRVGLDGGRRTRDARVTGRSRDPARGRPVRGRLRPLEARPPHGGRVVALLEVGLAERRLRDAFLQSLAVAGVDGTLEHRLQLETARGQVIAKTGTTRPASALSGFVRDRYVFAILQNGRPISTHWARRAQDRFATALAAAG